VWRGRLAGIGSEWSARYPGYLAGAIDAADAAINTILREHAS
jgi:monoamine oxidase